MRGFVLYLIAAVLVVFVCIIASGAVYVPQMGGHFEGIPCALAGSPYGWQAEIWTRTPDGGLVIRIIGYDPAGFEVVQTALAEELWLDIDTKPPDPVHWLAGRIQGEVIALAVK